MKILAISDVHADATLFGVPRYDEVECVMQRSVEVAVERRVDHYLFCGDLCDPDLTALGTVRAIGLGVRTALTLANEGIPSTWIVGNHDVFEDGSGCTTLSPLAELAKFARVAVAQRPGWFMLDAEEDVLLCALPFTASSHSYDPQKYVDSTWKDARRVIVAGHLSIEGVQPGEETKDLPRGRDVMWPHIDKSNCVLQIAGHYHRRQVHRGIQIVGSPARFAFGERDNDPGFLVIEVP